MGVLKSTELPCQVYFGSLSADAYRKFGKTPIYAVRSFLVAFRPTLTGGSEKHQTTLSGLFGCPANDAYRRFGKAPNHAVRSL